MYQVCRKQWKCKHGGLQQNNWLVSKCKDMPRKLAMVSKHRVIRYNYTHKWLKSIWQRTLYCVWLLRMYSRPNTEYIAWVFFGHNNAALMWHNSLYMIPQCGENKTRLHDLATVLAIINICMITANWRYFLEGDCSCFQTKDADRMFLQARYLAPEAAKVLVEQVASRPPANPVS